jgi:hypothetical protein
MKEGVYSGKRGCVPAMPGPGESVLKIEHITKHDDNRRDNTNLDRGSRYVLDWS